MTSSVTRFRDVFAKSNLPIKRLRHMVLESTVMSVREGDRFVNVDTGINGYTRFMKREVHVDGEELKVGSKRLFTVLHQRNPIGGMDLALNTTDMEANLTSVWAEIKEHHENGTTIMGRVLNPVNSGYAVGIGGAIAFMPKTRVNKAQLNPGVLQPFEILTRNDKSRNLVVAMPGVSMFSKANYAQRVPRAPAEGWSKYLAALKPRSEAASDPAQVDEGVQTLSDTEDEPIDGVKHGG